MTEAVLIFTLFHVIFYGFLVVAWRRINATAQPRNLCFSIIIPVRNEQENIDSLLSQIEAMDYPQDQFEVIVVDDFSEDNTAERVTSHALFLHGNCRLVSMEDMNKSGKKHAITRGVGEARFDHIITTDADCNVTTEWLRSYATYFRDNEFLAGPVSITGKGLFARLQQLEFIGLIGYGAITIENNNPSMCSGANLGFTKRAFYEVNGYQNNIQIPSGDDEFLLYNILKRYPGKATFIKDPKALVTTAAQASLGKFTNQRKRWTSKWKYNKNPKLRLMAVIFFLDYVVFGISLIASFFSVFNLMITLMVLSVRLLVDWLFLSGVNHFISERTPVMALLLLQIIYPVHVLFMGMSSIFGSYSWKGRNY